MGAISFELRPSAAKRRHCFCTSDNLLIRSSNVRPPTATLINHASGGNILAWVVRNLGKRRAALARRAQNATDNERRFAQTTVS